MVYIREAHPSGGRRRNPSDPDIREARSLADRRVAASECLSGLKLTIPVVLDTMDRDYETAYGGWPAGTVVIDAQGRIACWTPGSPGGCRLEEAEAVVRRLPLPSAEPSRVVP